MQSTIVRTQTRDRYVRVMPTVRATIRALGGGQLALTYVTWAINSQLRGAEQVGDTQVRRAMNELIRRGQLPGLVNQGHGVYRWHRQHA